MKRATLDQLRGERVRQSRLIRDAFEIMNAAPLVKHGDQGPPHCDACKWLNKVQKWYGRSGLHTNGTREP